MEVIEKLAQQFPQLYIKPATGASKSFLYQGIVRMGQTYKGSLSHFTGSPLDSLTVEKTPVGDVMVVFLKQREDFICFYQIMAKRCEPEKVPPTMGASFIQGFTDWSKIHAHMEEYKAAGGVDTDDEFARFTSRPENYRGALILLADGPYSAVSYSQTPYNEEEWIKLSRAIRKHHELTHFICRRLYPEEKHAVWDELLADCMGLVSAIGYYDVKLAQTFLGIDQGKYIGGRLENYTAEIPDDKMIKQVEKMMDFLAERSETFLKLGKGVFEMTVAIETEYVRKI